MDGRLREWIRTRHFARTTLASVLVGAGFVVASFAGCSTGPRPNSEEDQKRLAQQLRGDVRRLLADNESLRAQNGALKSALKSQGEEQASALAAARAAPPMASGCMIPPPEMVDDGQSTTEHFLYAKVLESFRSKNEPALRKSQELLLKSYPDSPFADNAAYLEAEFALASGERARAVRLFDGLLSRFPTGNKAPAALLGKAAALRDLRRNTLARDTLLLLRARYPGSPESVQAERELRGMAKNVTSGGAAG
jgi:TolA-binding protein